MCPISQTALYTCACIIVHVTTPQIRRTATLHVQAINPKAKLASCAAVLCLQSLLDWSGLRQKAGNCMCMSSPIRAHKEEGTGLIPGNMYTLMYGKKTRSNPNMRSVATFKSFCSIVCEAPTQHGASGTSPGPWRPAGSQCGSGRQCQTQRLAACMLPCQSFGLTNNPEHGTTVGRTGGTLSMFSASQQYRLLRIAISPVYTTKPALVHQASAQVGRPLVARRWSFARHHQE